jgi:hypothetical protein
LPLPTRTCRWSSTASTCRISPESISRDRRTGIGRRYLAQCLLPTSRVQLVHAVDDGAALQAAALASGFEGVIAKRKESGYEPGRRSASWVKVKPTEGADFVIGGYTQGKALARRSARSSSAIGREEKPGPGCATRRMSARASTIARSRR